MSKENEQNQADNLMKLFQEVANHSPDDDIIEDEETEDNVQAEQVNEQETYVELDYLNLPPRSEVHGKNKSRYSLTLESPITRFLFILLLIVIVFTLLIYFDVISEPFSLF